MPNEWLARMAGLVALLASGCLSAPVAAQRAGGDAVPIAPGREEPAALDVSVPTPASVLGHEIGDGAVRYEPLGRYLRALADASPRVTLNSMGESHEGRTLYHLTITSTENHARLADIRADAAKLADPRTLNNGDEANRIIDTLPGIAWLAYSIHGDELSSTDAAVQVAYLLAAGTDERTKRLRDELVIHIDPLQNPDGRERYLSQLQPLQGKIENPDYQAMQHTGLWSAGRGNHYLFDLNRDWVMQVHPETQGRAKAIVQWNPHLIVDSHEMGSLDTYLFDPPREPFNVNLSPRNLAWRRTFSADQAKAFDAYGWSYYTGDWYEEWYPGYTNAWANLLGAVGILYEQAGVNAASVRQHSGKTLTYREAVHHHVVSSFANLNTLRNNRREILRDYFEDRKWAVSPDRSGHETLVVPVPADTDRLQRLVDVIRRNGIEFGFAGAPFKGHQVTGVTGTTRDNTTFSEGALIVPAAQPHRRLFRAAFEFDPHMSNSFLAEERKELENHRDSRLYDITAWNVCMAFGLECYWAARIDKPPMHHAGVAPPPPPADDEAGYGFLVDGASTSLYPALARLLENGFKVRVAQKPFAAGGRDYPPGSLLLRNNENPANLRRELRSLAPKHNLGAYAVDSALSDDGPDLGGNHFRLLEPPRIAIASQWPVSTTSFGAVWHLVDARIGLRASPINVQAIGRLDLRRYNVLVLPDTWGMSALSAILTDAVRKKLRDWIEAGGTLIAIGDAAAFVAGKERNLSAVRLRREVLDELEGYAQAVERERGARYVTIDAKLVWGEEPAAPDQPSAAPKTASGDEAPKRPGAELDPEARKREDEWLRLFRPFGAIAAAEVDPENWLCFGVMTVDRSAATSPVLLSGSYALMSRHPVQTPVRLAPASRFRLSGLLWPEARQRWADTAYATVESVGRGQIILFAYDPFFRGYFEGSGRLLLNALMLGPGLGTSQPVPW